MERFAIKKNDSTIFKNDCLINSQHVCSIPRISFCAFCGERFEARSARRLYCSVRCRRSFQNERRRGERAEAMLKGAPAPWKHDPWDRDDEALYGNALLDASPLCGLPPRAPAEKGNACAAGQGAT